MNLKQLYGYPTLKEAYQCAQLLQAEGIECRLTHRAKGLLGDQCKTEFGYGLGGEVEAVVTGSVGVESLFPELIGAGTAVDAT